MQIGYEKKYDILVIMLEDDYDFGRTTEIEAGFLIDLDKTGKLVAIEIHHCSNRINSLRKYVEDATVDVNIEELDYSYIIEIKFNEGEKIIKKRIFK